MTKPKVSIVWFRQDLRLSDNPALDAAAEKGAILPIYILDNIGAGQWAMGGASRVWLHHSLKALREDLSGNLSFYAGSAADVMAELIERYDIESVYWNRCYEPWRISRDKDIKTFLAEQNIAVQSFNGSLLWEPWDIAKGDGTPYRVFTPYYRKGCLLAQPPRAPLSKPTHIDAISDPDSLALKALDLLPNSLTWAEEMMRHWPVGENGASDRLSEFLENGLDGYKAGRNYPSRNNVSRLSPYLHWGEISVNEIWHQSRTFAEGEDLDHFCSELGWREFSYYLMYHFPTMPHESFQQKFNQFPWREDAAALKAWQQGQTGIPIVDAGMRELWQTGYMHNRVRMIVASFLTKNLMIDWREGAAWFWDTLVDADLANNSASWQWVAGSGADAAPYFRIFNPVTQGQKFDGGGDYIRRYVPELRTLSDKYIFAPWEAPEDVLAASRISLGETYPKPLVDIKVTRVRALEAFKSLSVMQEA